MSLTERLINYLTTEREKQEQKRVAQSTALWLNQLVDSINSNRGSSLTRFPGASNFQETITCLSKVEASEAKANWRMGPEPPEEDHLTWRWVSWKDSQVRVCVSILPDGSSVPIYAEFGEEDQKQLAVLFVPTDYEFPKDGYSHVVQEIQRQNEQVKPWTSEQLNVLKDDWLIKAYRVATGDVRFPRLDEDSESGLQTLSLRYPALGNFAEQETIFYGHQGIPNLEGPNVIILTPFFRIIPPDLVVADL